MTSLTKVYEYRAALPRVSSRRLSRPIAKAAVYRRLSFGFILEVSTTNTLDSPGGSVYQRHRALTVSP
jgi:hypothetical protein